MVRKNPQFQHVEKMGYDRGTAGDRTMCVLILHHRLVPGYPVVVAANRDEARDRPSEPPLLWAAGLLAPRDRRAGGTWIGLNRHGLVVGITNRSREPSDPGRPSRGELVVEALTAPAARAAVSRVERAAFSSPRNPFNLLVADAREAFLVVGGRAGVNARPLPAGTHVLSNEHELGELDLGDLAPPPDLAGALERLRALCRDHGSCGYAVCKHGDRYGTVSSALIAAGDGPGHPDRFAFADGLPCETPHAEIDAARALRGGRV
jgi:hypothetical protein